MSGTDSNFANLSVPEKVFHLHQVGVETTLSLLKSLPGLPFKGFEAISEITAIPISAIRGLMAGLFGTPAADTAPGATAPKGATGEEPKRIVLTTKS
jgi:hypothetical protein